jgi:hypothetical protein
MDWASIPKEAYALLGAAVGALISIATAYLTQRGQRKLEREKLREARQDAMLRELGRCFQTMATDFGSAAHSMCWLTWQASHGNMTQEMIDKYNAEMHESLPKLVGGKTMIWALDPKLGDQLDEYIQLAYEVDEKIGMACLTFGKDSAAGLAELKALNILAKDFDEIIYRRLGEIGRGRPHTALFKWMARKWSDLIRKRKVS